MCTHAEARQCVVCTLPCMQSALYYNELSKHLARQAQQLEEMREQER